MYNVFRLQGPSAVASVPSLESYFDTSDADLHELWHDIDDDGLILVVRGADDLDAIVADTMALSGAELIDLNDGSLDLSGLGLEAGPAGSYFGIHPPILRMAAPPRRYLCPGCFHNLAIQGHARGCKYGKR